MNMMTADVTNKGRLTTREIVYVGIFAALMAVCSWISIPTAVPFTMQTFGVFIACLVLGGRGGTLAVLVYLILGAVGVPVFAGFTGGMGIILGSTGGYFVGFICSAMLLWALERVYRGKPLLTMISLFLALLVCYALGTVWFMIVYSRANGPVGLITTLGWCVFPFIIPDLIKIALAYAVSPVIRRAINAR